MVHGNETVMLDLLYSSIEVEMEDYAKQVTSRSSIYLQHRTHPDASLARHTLNLSAPQLQAQPSLNPAQSTSY